MVMWISRDEFDSLKEKTRKVDGLIERVQALEAQLVPFRAGEYVSNQFMLSMNTWSQSYDPDHRPKVPVRAVVQKILDHLRLRIDKTNAVPERITLEKYK